MINESTLMEITGGLEFGRGRSPSKNTNYLYNS